MIRRKREQAEAGTKGKESSPDGQGRASDRIKNRRERKVAQEYEGDGWEVIKKGWPDFLMFKDGRIKMIEVKRKQRFITAKMGLSAHQTRMREIPSAIFDYEVRYLE